MVRALSRQRRSWAVGALLTVVVLSSCGGTAATTAPGAHLRVVAAENFWGSIVAQLAGNRGSVDSVLVDPNADPHQYEPTTNDARAIADADYVIVNGAGYDSWARKLLDANPASARRVTTVADLLGMHDGDNAHFWYSPGFVNRVADRVTADLTALDPAGSAYFAQQRASLDRAFAPYRALIATIRGAYAGTKIAATETLFVYQAQALGLTLISPIEFMKAVAEGTDPPTQSVAQFAGQLRSREPQVVVYNVQTVTPTTTSMKGLAAQSNLPVVGISEIIIPANGVFQDWQAAQLRSLHAALATGAPTP